MHCTGGKQGVELPGNPQVVPGTEGTLRTGQVRYEWLVARAPVVICELAPYGTTLFVNDAVTGITGYKPGELLGKNWWDAFYPGEQRRHVDGLFRRFRSGDVADYEMDLTAKDGSLKTLAWNSSMRHSIHGTIESIVLFGVDVTERKLARDSLGQSVTKLRRTLEGTVQTMALTVETRDPYTAGHQRRVAELASAIAGEMGLSEEQVVAIRMAGMIHDIGKISVPSEILSKPGRINEFEFNLIKAHPRVGYDILKTVEFPWPIAQIVLQHHELLDGSGYPSGLKGNDTLLEAKILEVADVIEAMASHRPYRPALGIEEALKEALKNRGILYDPGAVDACARLIDQKGFRFEDEP